MEHKTKIKVLTAIIVCMVLFLLIGLSQLRYSSYDFIFKVDWFSDVLVISNSKHYNGEEIFINDTVIIFDNTVYPYSIYREDKRLYFEFTFADPEEFQIQYGLNELPVVRWEFNQSPKINFHGLRNHITVWSSTVSVSVGNADENVFIHPVSDIHQRIIISALAVNHRMHQIYFFLVIYFIALPILLTFGLYLSLQPKILIFNAKRRLINSESLLLKLKTTGIILVILCIISPVVLILL